MAVMEARERELTDKINAKLRAIAKALEPDYKFDPGYYKKWTDLHGEGNGVTDRWLSVASKDGTRRFTIECCRHSFHGVVFDKDARVKVCFEYPFRVEYSSQDGEINNRISGCSWSLERPADAIARDMRKRCLDDYEALHAKLTERKGNWDRAAHERNLIVEQFANKYGGEARGAKGTDSGRANICWPSYAKCKRPFYALSDVIIENGKVTLDFESMRPDHAEAIIDFVKTLKGGEDSDE